MNSTGRKAAYTIGLCNDTLEQPLNTQEHDQVVRNIMTPNTHIVMYFNVKSKLERTSTPWKYTNEKH